jgi:putative SOS response-associated peptidase YedK
MKDGSPFGLAGLWENWRNPSTGEWERTFVIITVPSNELVRRIHNRVPAILEPSGYERWLGTDPDPHDLLITYPAERRGDRKAGVPNKATAEVRALAREHGPELGVNVV